MVAPPIGIKLGILAELDAAVAASGYEGTKFYAEFVPRDDDPSDMTTPSSAINSDGSGNDSYQRANMGITLMDSTGANTTDAYHKALRWPSGSIDHGNDMTPGTNGLDYWLRRPPGFTSTYMHHIPSCLHLGGHSDDQFFTWTTRPITFGEAAWTISGSERGSNTDKQGRWAGENLGDDVMGPPSASYQGGALKNRPLDPPTGPHSVSDGDVATTHPLATQMRYNRSLQYKGAGKGHWIVHGQSTNPWTGNAWQKSDFDTFQWGVGQSTSYSFPSADATFHSAYFEPVPMETDYDDNDGTVANAPHDMLFSGSLDALGAANYTPASDGEIGGAGGYPISLVDRPRLGGIPDDAVIQYVAFVLSAQLWVGGYKNRYFSRGTSSWTMYVMFTSESGGSGV